jgi:hypothetical protein
MSVFLSCENCQSKLDQVQYGSSVCDFCETVFEASDAELEEMWQTHTNLIQKLVMAYYHKESKEEEQKLDTEIKHNQKLQSIIQKEITRRH